MRGHRGHAGRDLPRRLSLVVVLLLSASACAAGKNLSPAADPAAPEPSALECGRPFQAPSGGGLTLVAHFPRAVSAGEHLVAGTVEVASSTGAVRGVVTANADVFLVRDGRVATVPAPQDLVGVRLELAPGEVVTMPAQAALSPCEAGGAAATGSLPSGEYELYARVVVNHDDGSGVESIGGPWPFEVR